jgi:hypothetical protein
MEICITVSAVSSQNTSVGCAWSLLSVLIQYNVKDLLYEVFMPLEYYTSQKKNLVTLL